MFSNMTLQDVEITKALVPALLGLIGVLLIAIFKMKEANNKNKLDRETLVYTTKRKEFLDNATRELALIQDKLDGNKKNEDTLLEARKVAISLSRTCDRLQLDIFMDGTRGSKERFISSTNFKNKVDSLANFIRAAMEKCGSDTLKCIEPSGNINDLTQRLSRYSHKVSLDMQRVEKLTDLHRLSSEDARNEISGFDSISKQTNVILNIEWYAGAIANVVDREIENNRKSREEITNQQTEILNQIRDYSKTADQR